MVNLLLTLIPYSVLLAHIAFVAIILAIALGIPIGKKALGFFGKNAVPLAFLVSLLGIIGSLFYSDIVGYEPCVLCWWQRVFLYPLGLIFGLAWWKKLPNPFTYGVPLASIAGLIALYHSYTNLGGGSVLPCTAFGGACARLYVLKFGYITIPAMSLTIAVFILALAWANKKYEDSHA